MKASNALLLITAASPLHTRAAHAVVFTSNTAIAVGNTNRDVRLGARHRQHHGHADDLDQPA